MREGRLFSHPFQHITAPALDEMRRECLLLFRGRRWHIEPLEVGAQ
jgi:hypothetical protein